MVIRSYKGRNLSEALEKVKKELGDNALIVETRELKEPGLLGAKIGVEIVAAKENTAEQRPPNRSHERAGFAPLQAAEPRPDQDADWNPISLPEQYTRSSLAAQPRRQESQPLASTQAAQLQREQAVNTPQLNKLRDTSDVSSELAGIRRQLARLMSGQAAGYEHLGEELTQLFEDSEMPVEIMAELDEAIMQAGHRLPRSKRDMFVRRYLARDLNCSGGVDWLTCQHLLVAGPTGVGKTTSIAKMAGELVLKQGKRIALITIDTYRVGAADQLRAYADLLDVPFEVAQTPAQLRQLVERFTDFDHVLIDTAGRSPADATRVHELKGFCKAVPSLQVMLAISATCGRAEFAAAVERFSLLPVEHAMITKLDEVCAYGRLYGCLRRHHLPLRYVTTGQEVPEDIIAAHPDTFLAPLFANAGVPAPAVA